MSAPHSSIGNVRTKEKGVNVQVCVRLRPSTEEERRRVKADVVTTNESRREVTIRQTVSGKAGKSLDKTFTFDRVYGTDASQSSIYDTAVRPLVREVLAGYNCTIFAYGQTGTGKTYTMNGMENCRGDQGPRAIQQADGVIPRAINDIFSTLNAAGAEYSIKVAFLELYNEEITDLLVVDENANNDADEFEADDFGTPVRPSSAHRMMDGTKSERHKIVINDDGKGNVVIRGLDEAIVKSADEIYGILERGLKRRQTAETKMNDKSSRSHSVFTVTVHIKESNPDGEELIKSGKLNLVDLAGSESISRSGAEGTRAREAGNINKSLSALGRVITSLADNTGHVPYRDSKLTRMLRDSLGGKTKTCIIATISPCVMSLEETLSTLDYAHRAKNIKNRPEINQRVTKAALINNLTNDLVRLQQQLNSQRSKDGVYLSKDDYDEMEGAIKRKTERVEELELLLEAKIQDLHNATRMFEEKCIEYDIVHTDLEKSIDGLKKRDNYIEVQSLTENRLYNAANELSTGLDDAKSDVEGLFGKLARLQNTEKTNHNMVSSVKSRMTRSLENIEESLQQSLGEQNIVVSTLVEDMAELNTRHAAYSDSLTSVMQLTSSSLNIVVEDIKSVIFDSLQKSLNDGLQAIQSNAQQNTCEQIQQLEQSLESLSTAISIVTESITSSAQINQRWNEEHKTMLDMVSERLTSICDQGKKTMSTVAKHSSSIRSDIADLSQEQAKIWKQVAQSTSDIQEAAKKRFVDAVTRISAEVAADMSQTVESSLERAQSSMQTKTDVVTGRLNEIEVTASSKESSALSEWHQSATAAINKIGVSAQGFTDAATKVIQGASGSLEDLVKTVTVDTRDVVDKMHSASGNITMRTNEISQVFTGNTITILNKLAEHVMKNDATVDQGLKMVGNGMEISRSSIQLCNSFMQANKTWTKAYSESQSQYISHLSRQDVNELEQGLMLNETKVTLETPERRDINGLKPSDIESMRHQVDCPSPVPFRTIIGKINEDDEEEEAAEPENFQENVPLKKMNEANETRRPLSEHNKNLEH